MAGKLRHDARLAGSRRICNIEPLLLGHLFFAGCETSLTLAADAWFLVVATPNGPIADATELYGYAGIAAPEDY